MKKSFCTKRYEGRCEKIVLRETLREALGDRTVTTGERLRKQLGRRGYSLMDGGAAPVAEPNFIFG